MTYDAEWFDWQKDGSLSSARVVAPLINALFAPPGAPEGMRHSVQPSVLDVGCGVGAWASQWLDADGVDGDWVPPGQRLIERFHVGDLTKALDMGRRYDLVICLEVAEHLPASAAQCLVDSLCRHADVVVFSAAVVDQGGTDHINEQMPEYWARKFARRGYQAYDLLRDAIWWDQRVMPWYQQNMLVYATDEAAAAYGWARARTLHRVHPGMGESWNLAATVCIPWRPSPSRLAAFERIQQFWARTGWPLVFADSDTEVFSLAQARNNAVAQATTDIVVICDADTIPEMANIIAAVDDPVGVCWPFNCYRIIDPKYMDTPFDQLAGVPHVNTWDGDGAAGVGGCLVCTRKEYWRLGGQPPEFIGWGWEDTAFTTVVGTLSRVKRLPGNIYAFEHNTHAERYEGAKADSPGWDRDSSCNKHLMAGYENANGRPWLMRELLRRRDAGAMPPYIGAGYGAPNMPDPQDAKKALAGRFTP